MTSWSSGEHYEPYVGRWSRRVAREFIAWLDPAPGRRWIDIGCGTGAVTEAILRTEPEAIESVEPSPAYLDVARARIGDTRVSFRAGDALAIPVADEWADVVVSGLVLNFVPDAPAALREMRRALRGGGTIAAYVWDYASGMQFMRRFWDAAIALDPAAEEFDEGRTFPVCSPDGLTAAFEDAGLAGTVLRPIDIETKFRDFDDFWQPFLGRQGPAPVYLRSRSAEQHAELADYLRASLPYDPDGSIPLTARAWAIRASR